MIAILIPVYNDPDGLEMTMQSLREDTVEADIFIVDDGSDPPQEAPEPGVGQRIFLHRLDCNGGITRALNAGLREIVNAGRYEYVARIDAGDLAKPGRFFAQKAFLDANPDHAVVGGWADHVDLSARELFCYKPPTDHADLARFLRLRNGIIHPCAMIRMDHLLSVGGYDERFCGAEDYELWLRLANRYKVANLPQVLITKLVTPHQITARQFRNMPGLRVKLRYFDPTTFYAWLGVIRSLLALAAPRAVVLAVRGWLYRTERR
jgi:glycosyltransferase involved in cell wall biosynthesis